jgi:hypothetical protein
MSKNQEVAKTESSAVVAAGMDMGAWGAPPVSSKDIIIPKILCMQGLSVLVADEKAKMGDLVDSMTSEVIGNCKDKPVQFIPFHMEKVLIISKKVDGDFTFERIEAVTPENENTPYEETIGTDTFKNEFCMNFYVLRPEDMSLPYIISFKGMSRKAGKILATQMFVRNAAAGKIPPAFVMQLGGVKTKNDKGQFYVLESKSVRESSQEEITAAFTWYKTVNSGGVKAHEEELKKESESRF